MRTCSKCGEEKPDELCVPKKNLCRACEAARVRAYRAANLEVVNERNRAYYAENSEAALAQKRARYRANSKAAAARMKDYYTENLEKIAAYKRDYRAKNREALLEKGRAYRAKNRELLVERQREYAVKNPTVVNQIFAKRRAAKLQRAPLWLTPEHEAEMRGIYAHRDALRRETGIEYHVDHIVPLQGKNVSGLHVPWNLRVVPATENLSKSNHYTGPDSWAA